MTLPSPCFTRKQHKTTASCVASSRLVEFTVQLFIPKLFMCKLIKVKPMNVTELEADQAVELRFQTYMFQGEHVTVFLFKFLDKCKQGSLMPKTSTNTLP